MPVVDLGWFSPDAFASRCSRPRHAAAVGGRSHLWIALKRAALQLHRAEIVGHVREVGAVLDRPLAAVFPS